MKSETFRRKSKTLKIHKQKKKSTKDGKKYKYL